jgi:NADPH-dependent 2,4-dienoyl-CoA reductase/sulfur reductase-like enzyme
MAAGMAFRYGEYEPHYPVRRRTPYLQDASGPGTVSDRTGPYDRIVVGGGKAVIFAAIAARECGARVTDEESQSRWMARASTYQTTLNGGAEHG